MKPETRSIPRNALRARQSIPPGVLRAKQRAKHPAGRPARFFAVVLAALLFFAGAGAGGAQAQDPPAVVMNPVGGVDFGEWIINKGQTGVISMACSTTGAGTLSIPASLGTEVQSGRCGEVNVMLSSSAAGFVEFDFEVAPFSLRNGSSAIAVTPVEYDLRSSSNVVICDTSGGCGRIRLNTGQDRTFYIGGQLSIPANLEPGAYTATYTAEVTL